MRINVVKPIYLADQHLVAEYNEIHMMTNYINKSGNSAKGIVLCEIPVNYTLNKGHAKFFYNKIAFLNRRKQALVDEMLNRNMTVNVPKIDWSWLDKDSYNVLHNDWSPTIEDLKINLERIVQRISIKDSWYRMRGTSYSFEYWQDLYSKDLSILLF